MGRPKTRTPEDIIKYGMDYYYKHKDERGHEFSLVSTRSRLRKSLKALGDSNPEKSKKLLYRIEAITKELDGIRDARWQKKRAEGKALFKKFSQPLPGGVAAVSQPNIVSDSTTEIK